MDDKPDSNILNFENKENCVSDNIIEEITQTPVKQTYKDDNLRMPSIMLVEPNDIVDEPLISTSVYSNYVNKQIDKSPDSNQLDVEKNENFEGIYYSDVQGPINKEPDEKLSPQNKLKVFLSRNKSGTDSQATNPNIFDDRQTLDENDMEEIYNDCVNKNNQSTISSNNFDQRNVSASGVEMDNENKYTTPQKKLLNDNNENVSTNMNTYAFMSTYNNLPSSLSPSTRFLNQSFGNDKKEKNKKPWYRAFTNTYKQKNEEFKKLFKLPKDEPLLVDFSCALQREILAQGRLYISLNYVCFRANIIGWETTVTIKLKDIKNIFKDKTAKIIPNAITIVAENERYFFTTFVSRDKTYNTLFRVWQIALADACMAHEEIGNILKSSYGEDLGYDSDDIEYEYFSMVKHAADNLSECKTNESFESTTQLNRNSLTETSYNDGATIKLVKSSLHLLGHRHTSSLDPSSLNSSNLDYNENDNERPVSMLVSKQNPTIMLNQSKLEQNNLINSNNTENSQQLVSEKYQGLNIDDNNNTQRNKSNISADENESSDLENITNQVQSYANQENQRSIDTHLKPTDTSSSSPLHDRLNIRESSSDSLESDIPSNKIKQVEPALENNVKCNCANKHQGYKEMLNQSYDMSVNYLWECLFGQTDFCRKYWSSRKFLNFKVGPWNQSPAPSIISARKLEYSIDMGAALGKPANNEHQRILEYRPESCIVLESESETHGVLYSDYFTVRNRFCITRISATSSRLVISSFINYIIKPNFIAKTFIEKNCFSALKDSYNFLEKHLPNLKKQPPNVPLQISAITNSTANLDGSDLSVRASTPTSSNSVNKRNINQSEDDIFNKESPVKEESYMQNRYQKTNTKYTNNKVNKRRTKQETNNYNEIPSENNYTQLNTNSNNQFQAQLVPIQTFSFFKWKINVDTLVRLFIIAMICLMVINGMLYYKLRKIESLADGLRTDPTLIDKISALKHQKFATNKNTNLNEKMSNDLFDWRDVISNTLNVIEKMELSLKEWDKNLEKRQNLESLYHQKPIVDNEQSSDSKKILNEKSLDDL